MTEKPFCVISKQSNNDYERYSKGKFTLEEWEDVNYCEHCFSMDDEGLNDKEVVDLLNSLSEENEQLKKEHHLVHMQSMFSTVQSFKGDVSKRYKYSKETDTVYDTANHYGQYDKVLDKAEIVMLLNEYETVLNELNGDVE